MQELIKNTNMLGTLSDSVVNQITSSLIGKIRGLGLYRQFVIFVIIVRVN